MKRILFKDLNQMKLYTFRRNLQEWEKVRRKRIFLDLRKLKSMNIFLILQMHLLAHWILAIAFLLRWEIRFWTPNMTYIISFLLNTKSSRWQARNLHIFVEIFLLSKGEKSDEKSLLVYEYSLGFKRNKASLDHLSNLTKKVKIEVEISVSSCYSWRGFLRWIPFFLRKKHRSVKFSSEFKFEQRVLGRFRWNMKKRSLWSSFLLTSWANSVWCRKFLLNKRYQNDADCVSRKQGCFSFCCG